MAKKGILFSMVLVFAGMAWGCGGGPSPNTAISPAALISETEANPRTASALSMSRVDPELLAELKAFRRPAALEGRVAAVDAATGIDLALLERMKSARRTARI